MHFSICKAHRELQTSGLHPFIRLVVTLIFPCPVLWHPCHLFIANILVFEVWNVDYTSSMACRWEKPGQFHPRYCRKEQEQLWTYHRAGQGAEPHICACTLILPLLKKNNNTSWFKKKTQHSLRMLLRPSGIPLRTTSKMCASCPRPTLNLPHMSLLLAVTLFKSLVCSCCASLHAYTHALYNFTHIY